MIKQESSSSNEEEDHHEISSDDEDGELALMMRKFTRLSDKINKKGYNIDPKRRMFRSREDVKHKTCYNCGEKCHISPDCPKPDKRKKDNKSKHRHDSMFTSLEDPGDHEHVAYGDNSRGKVLGLGRIAVSKDLSISNVLFVEALSFNLISIA